MIVGPFQPLANTMMEHDLCLRLQSLTLDNRWTTGFRKGGRRIKCSRYKSASQRRRLRYAHARRCNSPATNARRVIPLKQQRRSLRMRLSASYSIPGRVAPNYLRRVSGDDIYASSAVQRTPTRAPFLRKRVQ